MNKVGWIAKIVHRISEEMKLFQQSYVFHKKKLAANGHCHVQI